MKKEGSSDQRWNTDRTEWNGESEVTWEFREIWERYETSPVHENIEKEFHGKSHIVQEKLKQLKIWNFRILGFPTRVPLFSSYIASRDVWN